MSETKLWAVETTEDWFAAPTKEAATLQNIRT